MKEILLLVLVLAAAGLLWVRFAPHDRDAVHVDPAEVAEPKGNGYRLIGPAAPRFPGEPDEVMEALMDVALAEPRARLLDGGPDEGLITFVSRTKWMGFPDYITFKATADGDMTKLALVSRARFGSSDLGVNRRRIDRWLAELEDRLGGG